MARKEIVTLHDDLDESITEGVETIKFGYAGGTYEIDLSPANRDSLNAIFGEFDSKMEPFLNVARKTPAKKTRKRK